MDHKAIIADALNKDTEQGSKCNITGHSSRAGGAGAGITPQRGINTLNASPCPVLRHSCPAAGPNPALPFPAQTLPLTLSTSRADALGHVHISASTSTHPTQCFYPALTLSFYWTYVLGHVHI